MEGALGKLSGIKLLTSEYLPDDVMVLSPLTCAKLQQWFSAAQAEELAAQPITQVKTPAAPTPEGEILRALYYACCEADAYGELSEYIDGTLLDRAKLLLT